MHIYCFTWQTPKICLCGTQTFTCHFEPNLSVRQWGTGMLWECTGYGRNCTIYIVKWTLYLLYCHCDHSAHLALNCHYTLHTILYNTHGTLYCSIYTAHYTVQYTLHTIMYNIHCTLYCTIYSAHYTINTVYTTHFTLHCP